MKDIIKLIFGFLFLALVLFGAVSAHADKLELTEVFFSVKEPNDPKKIERVPAVFKQGQQIYIIARFKGVTLQIIDGKRQVCFALWGGVTGPNRIVCSPFAKIGLFNDPHPEFDPDDAYFWIPYSLPLTTPVGQYRVDLAIEDFLGGTFATISATWKITPYGRDI